VVVLAASTALLGGCLPSTSSPTASAGSADEGHPFESELAYCVSEINRLRATIGKPALSRSSELEAYAAVAAREDAKARAAHAHARATNFGDGTSRAENEMLLWSLSYFHTLRALIERGLADMWKQGPGGVHYDNMTGNYREAGCGIYVKGDEVTVLQAFR
jgi:uncharacterized protein YkwD